MVGDFGIYFSNGELNIALCPKLLIHSVKQQEAKNDGQRYAHIILIRYFYLL